MVNWLIATLICTFVVGAVIFKLAAVISILLVSLIFLLPVGWFISWRLNKVVRHVKDKTTEETSSRWD